MPVFRKNRHVKSGRTLISIQAQRIYYHHLTGRHRNLRSSGSTCFDLGSIKNLGRVKGIIKDVEVNEKCNKMQHGLTKEIMCYFHYAAMRYLFL